VSATYLGWFAIATIALRPDHESLDSNEHVVEGGTELNECVLDRIEPPNRQAWPVPPPAEPVKLGETDGTRI
jgi:hypothetical protein